jgi:hypothetical protein
LPRFTCHDLRLDREQQAGRALYLVDHQRSPAIRDEAHRVSLGASGRRIVVEGYVVGG